METYIARQPMLNNDQKLAAYELLYYQDRETLYNPHDVSVANAIVQFFNQLDGSNFSEGREVFLTFSPNLLMQNIPRVFDPHKLVIQIGDDVLVHPVAKMIIQRYHKQGYRLAIVGFQFNDRYFGILPLTDIIKVDFSNPLSKDIETCIGIARKFGKQTAAFNVNSAEARATAIQYGCDYIQGQNVAEMVKSQVRHMEHLQSSFFRLMAAVTREEPDLEEIAQLIELDVTLTFSLLRMVNSAYFSMPNRVKDVKQALTILGLGQLKQWIYLLSFTPDEGLSDELIKTSFQRGSLCQELSQFVPEFPVSRAEAYLLGMFSTLEALLEVPIEDALRELPISDIVKNGLVAGEGKCGALLRICIAYEQGEWNLMRREAEALQLPTGLVAQKYLETVEYVNSIWSDLMRPLDDGE
ncbi:MAG: HDOD domain-containing protein [Oscillospiraceae bacterium]|jgi:EAL and modified HD-GYP domain-containing signal transduction protein|nr:HDOD domain-containing protein [Oscillospiraceae bacterium]